MNYYYYYYYSFIKWWYLLKVNLVNKLSSIIKAAESSPPIINDSHCWDELPCDVALKILSNLGTGDRARAVAVCKSWRDMLNSGSSIIPVPPEFPWLILPNNSNSFSKPIEYYIEDEICFQSLTEGRIYRVKLPPTLEQQSYCCGSSGGWLLMGRGPDLRSTQMFVWNPLSGVVQKLPPPSTIPFFSHLADELSDSVFLTISPFIARVEIFPKGSVDCVVAAVFCDPSRVIDYPEELALCTPHDQSWRSVESKYMYTDILFHGGKLYASCQYWEEEEEEEEENHNDGGGDGDGGRVIRKAKYVIHLAGCHVEVDILRLSYDDDDDDDGDQEEEYRLGFNIRERAFKVEHLVESSTSTGELLVVTAILDSYLHVNSEDDEGPIKTFHRTQTRGFELRRWRLVAGDRLEKLTTDIGEQGVFVGVTSSLSLSDSVEGVLAGHIYFATESAGGILGAHNNGEEIDQYDPDRLYLVREQGVFNVQNNRIRPTSLKDIHYQSRPVGTGWFTPKLFQT